ncbi:rRNA maturation RNase YbeY [Lewinella sp. 4G2]|nr:rRNA maturation RNase YbeY [Lewinella sp. 4G2]
MEFHVEEGGTSLPEEQYAPLTTWIEQIIATRGGLMGPINYIFCGDTYLHAMNVEYLDHDTLTDIITFPYERFPTVSGDLFISTERVKENAVDMNASFRDELHRVMIHGVLHLCGQGDKSDEEAKEMRSLEDWALSQRPAELTGEA